MDEEELWNRDRAFVQRAIALRHAQTALSLGSYQTLYADRTLFACQRDL